MIRADPKKLIAIGFVFVLIGFVVPLLMTIRVIMPSFIWGFLSYGASVAGLLLGLVGAFTYTRIQRGKRQ